MKEYHNVMPSIGEIVQTKGKETQLVQLPTTRKILTRTDKLENLLSHFEIPKYWLRVILLFLIREDETDIQSATTRHLLGE